MPRLNRGRQNLLSARRVEFALEKLTELGLEPKLINASKIEFEFKGHSVSLWPYTGWHSGESIKPGRGIVKLLTQLQQ